MSPLSGADPGKSPAPLRFICKGCGTPLILPDASATVSGPCPKCAAWIDAARYIEAKPYGKSRNYRAPEPATPQKRSSQGVIGGRGRVRADGFLDHEYNERRELYGTLRVIAVSLAVLAVILFITMYMRQWMAS